MAMSATDPKRRPSLEVVIPCLNEQTALPVCVRRLHDFMSDAMTARYDWRILIVDNGSTDSTWDIAQDLSVAFAAVSCRRLERRGRGLALRRAWTASEADLRAYMDVDLSTDLTHLPELIALVAADGCDLAIASRLSPGSRVTGRSLKREITSRGYNLLLRFIFRVDFRDAQCGFKAIRRTAAEELIPLTEGDGWFFDSELLILARELGYRIRELPVRWTDDPDTRVRLLPSARGALERPAPAEIRRRETGAGAAALRPRPSNLNQGVCDECNR